MPNFIEQRLREHVPKGVDPDRYVYGAMNNMGAMHGSKETAKGRQMEAKHEEKMKTESSPMRSMRIEIHRGPKGEVTGHTVHHDMMPKASKSGAFMEHETPSFPFGATDHAGVMANVSKHLKGQMGGKEASPAAGAGEGEGEGDEPAEA